MKTFPDIAMSVGARKLSDLISMGADLEQKDAKGRTALFRVSRVGNLEKVNALINAGADQNVSDTTYGEAPLQRAARGGYLDCVRALQVSFFKDSTLFKLI
jgi:ankyrin repeat protein